MEPKPEDDSWKSENKFVEFKSILEGKGLIQTNYDKLGETEVYFFYDSAKGILYGSSVDANGYVWQTQMGVNNKGGFDATTGGPVNDPTLTVKSELNIISKSEMSFEHKEYKNGEEVLSAKGVFHRLPKY